MELIEPSLSEIKRYLELTKRKGAMTLSILGKLSPEINAIFGTEIGKEILKEDMDRIEELMVKIYRREASDIEMAEFEYLKDKRIPHLLGKLKSYLEKTEEVRRVVQGK